MHPVLIAFLILFLMYVGIRIGKRLPLVGAKKPRNPDDAAMQDLVRQLQGELLTAEEREKLTKEN